MQLKYVRGFIQYFADGFIKPESLSRRRPPSLAFLGQGWRQYPRFSQLRQPGIASAATLPFRPAYFARL